jgi:hypothetical protein
VIYFGLPFCENAHYGHFAYCVVLPGKNGP